MTATKTRQPISISVDGIWAGSGWLVDGYIEDCGAQFCDDNDRSMDVYDCIEAAIEVNMPSLKTNVTGVTQVVTWLIT